MILDDGSEITKSDLLEFKNDAIPEEAWVNCDECQCSVHQVCALFSDRTNRSSEKFTCPNCVLKRGDVVGFPVAGQKFMKGAEDLERCKMSDAIEEGMRKTLEQAYLDRAKDLSVDVDNVERAHGLTVRILSSVEKKHHVGEEMVRRYGSSGCPSEYPVRSKCIALFQRIHGVDTMLFAMYVYEYGHDCPAPNRRRVYISYLDSVKYFEPKCYRTIVYHSILLEYLRYVKGRGFHTAHIWSCPPTPGDDYVFYIRKFRQFDQLSMSFSRYSLCLDDCFSDPSHQLFPREDMLRAWYHKVLEKAKSEGVVIRTSTLYDEYFNSDIALSDVSQKFDPLCVPYFEGDYIPGEIENIIKHLKEKGIEQADGAPDEVMKRLKHNIGKMKENFIVVHLRNRRFAAAVERGEDVSSWPEDSDEELVRSKRAKISGKEAPVLWSDSSARKQDTEVDIKEQEKTLDGRGDTLKIGELSANGQSTKRSFNEIGPAISSHLATLDRQRTVVGDTKEEDPSVESDLFESRQKFLNYCQTNHCQFDELRRAKHSTLMVLFQLHKDRHEPVSTGICDRVRERNQRVRKIQQLMDERRRQAQNELYHTGSEGEV